MKLNENLHAPETDKVKDEIEEKLDRLQKQNEAESIALKKLLTGLDKIEKSKINNSDLKSGHKKSK